jgi:protein-S-isoprenylcysteine O-methyltransferase Ste14
MEIVMENELNQQTRTQAIQYSLLVMFQRVLGLLCFLFAAGTFTSMRGWIYFSLYFIISVLTLIVMMNHHQITLSERGKKHKNTPLWDKTLLAIYVPLAFYGIYIVAGLDVRINEASSDMTMLILGIMLFLISSIFGVWPILENKHFESTSRIQSDREQAVITSGPYHVIRHPGYSSIILWAISVPMIFGSLLTGIVSLCIIVVIVIRTYLEDSMLRKELLGYTEYCMKVKYRLIPYIW